MTVHGYPDALWARAKGDAKGVLMPVAHARQVIAYSDVVPQIRSISFLATDQRFFSLLREISAEEYHGGRGMLEAVAVRKAGDHEQVPGFFDLARGLGLNVSDTDHLGFEQINKVHNCWDAQQLSQPAAACRLGLQAPVELRSAMGQGFVLLARRPLTASVRHR